LPFKFDAIIYNDGAKLEIKDEIVFSHTISDKILNYLMSKLNKFNINYGIEINNSFYCNFHNNIVDNDKRAFVNYFDHLPKNIGADKIVIMQQKQIDLHFNIKKQLTSILIDNEFITLKNKKATKDFFFKFIK